MAGLLTVDMNSGIELRARVCKGTATAIKGKAVRTKGAWAFEHEGIFYCPFADGQASCAGNESRVIQRRVYSSDGGWQNEKKEYYVCGVLNNRQEEDGRRKES